MNKDIIQIKYYYWACHSEVEEDIKYIYMNSDWKLID